MPEDVVEFKVMLVGLREVHARPFGTVSDRLTVPEKPLTLAAVMVAFASLPVRMLVPCGLTVRLKSTPVTGTIVEVVKTGEIAVTLIAALPVCDPAVTVSVTF